MSKLSLGAVKWNRDPIPNGPSQNALALSGLSLSGVLFCITSKHFLGLKVATEWDGKELNEAFGELGVRHQHGLA